MEESKQHYLSSKQEQRAEHILKPQMLSMIAHELRAPLHSINGYLDLALAGVGGDLNEQQSEFVRRARAGSEHLYALLEDLLLISRADLGQLQLKREITTLPPIIHNAVEELELTSRDLDVKVVIHIPDPLPRLYADPMRLQQVLRNLISNALHFTLAGGQITISAHAEHNFKPTENIDPDEILACIKLRISDTGVGIAPEYQQHIFERFYQAPNQESRRAGGQGIGLAVVKKIIELHNGSIEVESNIGKGSIFTCILPSLTS